MKKETKIIIGLALVAGAFYMRKQEDDTFITPILGVSGMMMIVMPMLKLNKQ